MTTTGTDVPVQAGTGIRAARILLMLGGVLIILGLGLPEFGDSSFIFCPDEPAFCVATTLEHGSPLIPVVIALAALGRPAADYARGLSLAAAIGALLIFGAHLAYPLLRSEAVGVAVYPGIAAGVVLLVAAWRLREPA